MKACHFFCLTAVWGLACLPCAGESDATYPMHEGRELVWSDEFDGSDIDPLKWEFKRLTTAVDLMFANDSRTYSVSDGLLHLRVVKSGDPVKKFIRPECLATHDTMNYRYGYLEMRARLPFRHGAWPAFWTQTPKRGRAADCMAEVDIFEAFSSSNSLQSAIHKWGGAAGHCSEGYAKGIGQPYVFADCSHLNEEFHVYGYEWTPEMVKFYVDGVCYQSFYIDEAHDFKLSDGSLAGMQCFHDPEGVIISFGAFTEGGSWCPAGYALTLDDEFPLEYDVDWVRLWQKPSSNERITYNQSAGHVIVQDELTVGAETVTLFDNMIYDVKRVALTAATSVLGITVPANLKSAPSLTLAAGARIDIAAGVILEVSQLTVNGVEREAGDYTAENLPDSVTGTGTLRVGPVATHAAQRIVWTGPASNGVWTTAANWDPPYVPGAGDTAVFTSKVWLAATHALIDDGTLAIETKADVTDFVKFSGTGSLVKSGSGCLDLRAISSFKGGATVIGGTAALWTDDALGAKSGEVVLDFTQDATVRLHGRSWEPEFKNPVIIRGPTGTGNAIQCGNKFDVLGPVTADCDFTVRSTYGPLSFRGGVSAPGHTMTYDGSGYYQDDLACLVGTFDVALTLKGAYGRTLSCSGTGEDHPLAFLAGTNTLSATFYWAGTNIVLSGARTLVTVQSGARISPDSVLGISDGAQLSLANGVRLNVLELVVDGVKQPRGAYSCGSFPSGASSGVAALLPGEGVLIVGSVTRTWAGGKTGDISAAANWGGTAPAAGDTLVFPSAVTLTGSFDLGVGGLTLDCQGEVTSQVAFSGEGALAKTGPSLLALTGASAHTGGTTVTEGGVSVRVAAGAGAGTVTVDRSTEGSTSYVEFKVSSVATTFANAIHVMGTHVDTFIGSSYSEASAAGNASVIRIVSGPCTFSGAIDGEGSISLRLTGNSKTSATFTNQILVPVGEKILLDLPSGGAGCVFRGAVYGTLVKYASAYSSWNSVNLYAPSGRAGDSLITYTGPVSLSGTATWAGNTLVATNLSTGYYWAPGLNINGTTPPLSSEATVYFTSRKIYNDPSFSNAASNQRLKALYFDGVRQPDGVYLSGDLDGLLTGAGTLLVGDAESYTWIGGASGRWSEATNWDPEGVPGAGSIVSFTNVVKTAKETVNVGEKGIVLSSTVNWGNARGYANLSNDFVGAGAITKIGVGSVELFGTSTYAGMTRVMNGNLNVNACNTILPNPITLYSTSGMSPQFGSGKGITYTNDIHIVGTAGSPSFVNSNSPRSYGNIVSEDDFTITCSWAGGEWNPTRIYGTISAPGKTVTVSGFNTVESTRFYSVTSTEFDNDVNASISKAAFAAPMIFAKGTIGSRSEKLTIQGGTNIVRAAAHMAFTNIVLKAGNSGAYCSIRLDAPTCVEEDAEFRLTTATVSITVKTGVTEKWTITPKIVVPKNVRVRVGRVIADGVEMPNGVYRAGSYDWLGGEGRLVIGPRKGVLVILR